MSKTKFTVPVFWSVCASVEIEAENEDEAIALVRDIDLDLFDNQEYLQDSFDVDTENIVAAQAQKQSG